MASFGGGALTHRPFTDVEPCLIFLHISHALKIKMCINVPIKQLMLDIIAYICCSVIKACPRQSLCQVRLMNLANNVHVTE